jgi:hypothetical protein
VVSGGSGVSVKGAGDLALPLKASSGFDSEVECQIYSLLHLNHLDWGRRVIPHLSMNQSYAWSEMDVCVDDVVDFDDHVVYWYTSHSGRVLAEMCSHVTHHVGNVFGGQGLHDETSSSNLPRIFLHHHLQYCLS